MTDTPVEPAGSNNKSNVEGTDLTVHVMTVYRGADKSSDRPDLKKQLKGHHFSSDAKVIAAAETWLDGQLSELFLSGLQKVRDWSL